MGINRREFLEEIIATQNESEVYTGEDKLFKKYANKHLPSLAKTTSTLNPYTGSWTQNEVMHLLRRTTFGVKPADIATLLAMSPGAAVDYLFSNAPTTAPAPPVNNYNTSTYTDPTGVLLGQTWVNAAYGDGTVNSKRQFSLKSWWTGLMINQNLSILEKMTFFWHNHFSTQMSSVGEARYLYIHHAMLRANALGNFKTLTRMVTTDPAMLRYLNGYLNTKTAPDENYGRELQELFTVGKYNVPNYVEADVQAAAKVLTGWRINNTTMASYFDSTKHDTNNKQFSAFYNNTAIAGLAGANGANETDSLINMIFSKQETAKYICGKLYRYFVYYIIDSATQANIVDELAITLVNNNFDIVPVLKRLLKSEHFFDMNSRSCYIRTPLDFLIGTFRTFNINIPNTFTVDKTYSVWNYIRNYGTSIALDLGDPPNVAGYPAYYQNPEYYELWINSNTLPKRMEFTDMMLNSGFNAGTGTPIKIDPLAFTQAYVNAGDPDMLVDYFVQLLLGLDLSATHKTA